MEVGDDVGEAAFAEDVAAAEGARDDQGVVDLVADGAVVFLHL